MHDHEHEGEEHDHAPERRETGSALRPVVPRDEAVELEELGETQHGG